MKGADDGDVFEHNETRGCWISHVRGVLAETEKNLTKENLGLQK